MADRIGLVIVAVIIGTFFFICAFDVVSWSNMFNKVWAGIGGIICFSAGIRAAMGKLAPQKTEG